MLGVVLLDGGCESGSNELTAEVDGETESAAGTVFETGAGAGSGLAAGSNAVLEVSGATIDESDGELTGATAATSADPGSDDWTAAFADTLLESVAGDVLDGSEMVDVVSGTDVDFGTSTGTIAADSIAAAAVASILAFGTAMTPGGGAVICAAGVDDKEGSKRSEGTAGFIKSEPGPETDNKSERICCGSTGTFCWLGVEG